MTTPTLAGPVQPLHGHVEPEDDEVIVVFRNGKVYDVYGIGDRAGSPFLRFKRGTFTYARLLRSDIKIGSTVPSVSLADNFVLPHVQVHAFVALNDEDGYGPLRRRLLERGLTFMEALSSELHGEMHRFVREIFAGRQHEEVVARPTPETSGVKSRLLKDLFVVDSVHVNAFSSDPLYEQRRTAIVGQEVDIRENERLKLNADARGITVLQLESPELVELDIRNRHELTMAIQQAELERQRIAVESERVHLEWERAQLEAQAKVAITAMENARELSRVKTGVLPDLTSFGRPAPIGFTPAASEEDGIVELAVRGPLGRDSRLVTAWKRAGAPVKAVRGLVEVEDDGRSLVLLALDESAVARADVPLLLSEAFPEKDVVVLPESPVLIDWVVALVQHRAPEVMGMEPQWLLEERDEVLHIQIGSASGRAGSIVKALLAPGVLIVPALDALLPYDDIECTTAVM